MQRPFAWLRDYRRKWLGRDALAGAALAALLVPESLGYASVAGLPPEVGLFAAPLALLGYAAFGGSRIAVVATASAVSAVSASVVGSIAGGDASSFLALSAWLAILSGLVYLTVGVLRMGWLANFMSGPVIHGFIVGLAIFIIAGQLDGLIGYEVEGESALGKMADAMLNLGDWDALTLGVGLAGLGLLFALHHLTPRTPAALVVMALGMLAVLTLDLDDRGLRVVGSLPTGLPTLGVPSTGLESLGLLIPGALAVTLVGFSEGFAAVRAYAPAGSRIDVNRELVAFGVSNLGAGLSSGMVVGGSLSKTAAADSAGGRTQVTSIVSALLVVAALLFIGPVFAYLPEALLAAVVIHAVWGLIRVDVFRRLWRVHRFDFSVAVLVLIGTLLLEPIYAVVLGVVVSLSYVVYRISFPRRAELGIDPASDRAVDLSTHPDAAPIPGVVVYRMEAPLIYPNAAAFEEGLQTYLDGRDEEVRRVVIDCEAVFTVDSTGMDTLGDLVSRLGDAGVEVALARVRSHVLEQLQRDDVIGESRAEVYPRVEDAISPDR